MKPDKPPVPTNAAAREDFRALATELGLKPDDPWIGGYVSYEWDHGRHVFQTYIPQLAGQKFLEFGCNVGGSSVILAGLGADVVGVEINPGFASLADANIRAHGFGDRARILHLEDTRQMPFDDGHFDAIVCNSVLEYIQPEMLADVEREILRILSPGGVIFVLGTSNRLWPRETHSGRWFANYLPRALDKFLFGAKRQRGISPFSVLRGFRGCALVDMEDSCETYLRAKELMGVSRNKLATLRFAARLLRPFGIPVGMLTPSFSMTLRKPGPNRSI